MKRNGWLFFYFTDKEQDNDLFRFTPAKSFGTDDDCRSEISAQRRRHYADPPYFSTEDMYEVGFGWDDHVRLRETLGRIKGKFLLSYNDCPEIRELYDGFSLFDFSRTHSMAQRYEAGKEFKELLIANYDYYERENAKPKQLTLFDIYGDENYDYEKILKESIISCKIR